MANYDIIVKNWTQSEFVNPSKYILFCDDKQYAVLEDSSSVINVVSKKGTIYAVARGKVQEMETEEGVVIYYLENPRYLKVISCTDNTNVKPVQKFIKESVIKYLIN